MSDRLLEEKEGGCVFKDGSYPCYPIKEPDCELCHKIYQAALKAVGERLKAVRDESYDQQTFNADLNEFTELALKGKLLPRYEVKKVGTIFINPKFNPRYAKPHRYKHSDGYPEEEHICVCGEKDTATIHTKRGELPE